MCVGKEREGKGEERFREDENQWFYMSEYRFMYIIVVGVTVVVQH